MSKSFTIYHMCKNCHNIFSNKNILNSCKKATLIPSSSLTPNYQSGSLAHLYNFTLPCEEALKEIKKNYKPPKSVPHPH